MPSFTQSLLAWLADNVPLEGFAFVASFLEEVIAPLPSPLIGAFVGSFALAEGYDAVSAVLLFGFLMAAGKAVACALIYWLIRYASQFTINRFENFLGVTAEQIASWGRYIVGTPRDYVLLILARAVPFVPSSPLSVLAGILKTPFRFYIIATFVGSYIRSGIFIWVGYTGAELVPPVPHLQELLIGIGAALIALCGYWIYSRYTDKVQKP